MPKLVINNGAANTQKHCDELVRMAGSEPVTIDLSALSFVGPLFLVRLRAWLDYHAFMGVSVTVLPPASHEVQHYMSRMHLTDNLGETITFPLPTVRENPRGDRLIPLTRLEANGKSEFDDLLGDLLRSEDMRYAGYLGEVVEEAAQEMILNAVDHGENPVGAYIAAQRFTDKNTTLPHRCVVAIGDFGIGMAKHLKRGGHAHATDSKTIAHGLTDMVSGTGIEYRGRGYSVPFEVAGRKDATVRLRVRANNGWVERRDGGKTRMLSCRPSEEPGTWVEFQFAHAISP